MSDPIFGIVLRKRNVEPRPAFLADMDTVGIIGPAPGADVTAFPLNTPVRLFSNDTDMLEKLGPGVGAGLLRDAVEGLNAQLGDMQRAVEVVVVRTALGANADPNVALQQTIANIMGSSTNQTGLWAFTLAPEMVGRTPRLICAPGYTAQLATGVEEVEYAVPGAGYVPGAILPVTFTGGGANAVQAQAHAVVGPDGVPGPVIIDHPGAFYTSAPTATLPAAPNGGINATVTASTAVLANPVVSMLPAVCSQLLAHAVVESAGTSLVTDEAWRETINSERIIPIRGGVKVMDPDTAQIVVRPAAPRVIGAIVRRDFETGGPFHSAANQPIYGVLGPAFRTPFSITSAENEAQALLAANIGVIVAGEVGSDFAIASGGFVFIGTDNAGEDELWRFYNQTRGRDFIHLTMLRALRFYLGRFNVTPQVIQAIINTMDTILGDLQADESLLGYRVDFVGTQNSAEEIRKGHITVTFRAEEPAVLRKITVISSRYRPAVDAMIANLERQLNLAA